MCASHRSRATLAGQRQPKVLLSLRVDPNVLAWFRAQGPGYQTRMTAVLHAYMDHGRGDQG